MTTKICCQEGDFISTKSINKILKKYEEYKNSDCMDFDDFIESIDGEYIDEGEEEDIEYDHEITL